MGVAFNKVVFRYTLNPVPAASFPNNRQLIYTWLLLVRTATTPRFNRSICFWAVKWTGVMESNKRMANEQLLIVVERLLRKRHRKPFVAGKVNANFIWLFFS